ncbi:MAG TPA: hypothetical protein GX507_07195 [Clostridia bacterium]|nr:hypothetical protein [Clostridia bacterium]
MMETQEKDLAHEEKWSGDEGTEVIQNEGKEGNTLESLMAERMAVGSVGGVSGGGTNREQKGYGSDSKGLTEKMALKSTLRRGRGRAWTPEEDAWLLRSVEERALSLVRNGGRPVGIARAIEDIAANLDRTSVAVRARYYRLLQGKGERDEGFASGTDHTSASEKESGSKSGGMRSSAGNQIKGAHGFKKGGSKRSHSGAAALSAVPLQEDQDSFLLGLSEFLRRAKNIRGLDLDGMVRGLARLAELAEAGINAPGMSARISELEQRKEDLEERVNELTSQLERVKEQYRTLDYLINEFINLGSVEKVTSLGDFGRKLKYQVDQFGLVVNVKRV